METALNASHPEDVGVHVGEGGDGVVLSVGTSDARLVAASVLLLRKHGCNLPVEVWEGEPGFSARQCALFKRIGVVCRTFPPTHRYGTKIESMARTSFRRFVYIDADAFVLGNPCALLNSAEFNATGAMFWPDMWGAEAKTGLGSVARGSHVMWGVTGVTYNASEYAHAREFESGLVLMDKARHWRALGLTAATVRENAIDFFAVVLGDKDMFRFSFLALGAPFHLVPRAAGRAGHVTTLWGELFGEVFCPSAIVQRGLDGCPLLLHQYTHQKRLVHNHAALAQPLPLITHSLVCGEGAWSACAAGGHDACQTVYGFGGWVPFWTMDISDRVFPLSDAPAQPGSCPAFALRDADVVAVHTALRSVGKLYDTI